MKKQEIKRRKRVMPATPGQQQLQILSQPTPASVDSSVSPDPTAHRFAQHPDSPTQQLRAENGHASAAEEAQRKFRTIAIDYTDYDPNGHAATSSESEQQHSDASRKRTHSTSEQLDGPPASRVQRLSPHIQSLLADQRSTEDAHIDPSLSAPVSAMAYPADEKEQRASVKAQKQREAELMRRKLAELESEIAGMGEDA